MKHLLFIAAGLALATAKPETYRENEDFQYSRSSSDEGSKSGFYGAQRGNMGGNYERAHNMDGLAQHQMSTAVRQIEGELGDGANTKTGSVFTSANSRGTYGSGKYDLTNLQGRNFQEGQSLGAADSQSHSSLSSQYGYNGLSSSSQRSGYNSQNSRYTGYQGTKSGLQTGNLQSLDTTYGSAGQDYSSQGRQSTGYYSQSGYHGQSSFDHDTANQQSASFTGSPSSRIIVTTPVRVYGRPGQRIAIPVGVQTYDTAHDAYGAYDATHSASTVDQNAINSDAEVLSNGNQNIHYRPTNNGRHYESSYNYRKQWEKHDVKPEIYEFPATPSPYNSELYDDTQAHSSGSQYQASGLNSHSAQSNAYSGYNSNVKTAASSQSRHQAGYNSHSANSDTVNTHGAYNAATGLDSANLLTDTNSKPKSYESSYAYHKSWERQGDPYVIKPVSNSDGLASERLTAASASNNQRYSSHQYGSQMANSHQSYNHGGLEDCDENGQIRVARSAPQYPHQQNQGNEDLGQHTQQLTTGWGREDLRQQGQIAWDTQQGGYGKLEDLGQQSQSGWNDLQQPQSQNRWDKLQLGQQTQNQWDNLEDLGQQTQTDLGQQTQDTWNIVEGAGKHQELEDLGQKTQDQWDFGQQEQSSLDQHETQNQDEFDVHSPNIFMEQDQSTDNLPSLNQSSSSNRQSSSQNQNVNRQNVFNKVSGFDSYNLNQNVEQINKDSQSVDNTEQGFDKTEQNFDTEQSQSNWHHISQTGEDLGQQTQQIWGNIDNQNKEDNSREQIKPVWELSENHNQQTQNTDSFFTNHGDSRDVYDQSNYNNDDFSQHSQTDNEHFKWNKERSNSWQDQSSRNMNMNQNALSNTRSTSSLQNLWDKIKNLEQTSTFTDHKNKISNYSLNGNTSSQTFLHSNWTEQSDYSDTFNSQHNFDQQNQFSSHYGGYPWQPNNSEEGTTSTTVQPTVILESITTSTTGKPKGEITNDNNIRPQDIGRGDIGPEDSVIPEIDKPHKSSNNDHSSPVFISNKHPNKTPEEIEALSLSTINNMATNSNQQIDIANTQQTESNLGVLSLDQQKHESNLELSKNTQTYTTPKNVINQVSITNYQSSQSVNKQRETHDLNRYHESRSETVHYNNPNTNGLNPTSPVSEAQRKPANTDNSQMLEQNPEKEQHNMEQQLVDLEDFSHQSANDQQLEQFGQFNQQTQNSDQQRQQNSNKFFGHLGQFEQQNENGYHQNQNYEQQSDNLNLNRQRQTLWGQNPQDLDQQSQTVWDPQESLQHNYKQFEQMDIPKQGTFQADTFYNERYQVNSKNQERAIQKNENSQSSLQSVPRGEKLKDPERPVDLLLTPPETITEKPGFWKKVGSKFTSAKDTVASWFKKN